MSVTTKHPPRAHAGVGRVRRALALATAAVVGAIPAAVVVAGHAPAAQAASTSSAFSTSEWANPSMTYRPGVRWWWSGGAVEDSVLDQQLDYLSSHGFGTVEINPFGAEPVAGDEDRVKDIYTPTFYAHLEHAVAKAKQLGITVDLNMGSGWNANSQFVTEADGQQNMGLGRSTATGATLKAGGVTIPAVALSKQYDDPTAGFSRSQAKLEGVLVARRTGVVDTVTGGAQTFDGGATTWDQRISVDPDDSFMIDAADLGSTSTFDLPADVAARVADGSEYEVVALYALPSDSSGVDSARPDWYVVNHMDATKTLDYLNDWLGEENLNRIVTRYDNIRAVFNDSLELSTDTYYDDGLYELAKDAEHNGLGYDFSKYLPTVYRQNLGAPAYFTNQLSGSATPYVTTTTNAAVQNRILADFRTLVGERFAQGLKGFQKGAHDFGLEYRQQAYNPPLDEIGSAKYVDIPEEEQANEANLRTAASGGHLYGRNLVTAEQFTLGQTPLSNSLESLKVGFDLMATSGVNNFFYHGLPYPYGQGTTEYGEQGWSAFPTIGVDPSSNNTLSKYFGQLNAYASRLNYLGQQGEASTDVAVYTPFGGKAPTTGAVPVLNSNGYAWDAINDASITDSSTTYEDGRISVNGGKASYGALVVQSANVPVATMQRLLALAEQGAPIVFYGSLPTGQSGYADGAYAAQDAQVVSLANQTLLEGDAASHPTSSTALVNALKKVVDPEITYEANDNVRFIRRDLSDGGTLTFLRNTGSATNTITLHADDRYASYYWLDQNTGKVYDADVTDGTVTFTLDAGNDALSGFGGSNPNKSRGIALLAEPAGVTLPASAVSAGMPEGVDRVAPETTQTVTPTSLTVTADNLDGVIGGDVTTKTFTDGVLGNWKDASFQGGQLQSVVSDGVYTATVDVDKAKGRRYVLDLGSVYTAASVTVNGTKAGDVLWAPYEVDVTDQLRSGSNTIEIAVTPRKANRYYPAATNANGQLSTTTPVDAGLVGPVSLEASAVGDAAPAAVTAPRIAGTATVGRTLTASPGTWDVAGSTYAYQWLRNGSAIGGATGSSYRVVPADAGRTLTVRVTATASGYRPGTATSAGRVVARLGSAATIRLSSAKVTVGKRARVTVTVRTAGLTPTGRVSITRNGKVVATVMLKAGRASVRLPRLRKGTYRIAVRYAGDAQVLPSTASARLRVTAKR
jgi:hypothetical protein